MSNQPFSKSVNKPLAFSRLLVSASCMALIIIFSVDVFLLSPSYLITLWLVQVLPIAAFIPAIIKGHLRAYQWLCFIILLYFTQSILDVFSPDRVLEGVFVTFFCVLLFSSAIFFVHGTQKIQKAIKANTD